MFRNRQPKIVIIGAASSSFSNILQELIVCPELDGLVNSITRSSVSNRHTRDTLSGPLTFLPFSRHFRHANNTFRASPDKLIS